jgi:hypothetical protein
MHRHIRRIPARRITGYELSGWSRMNGGCFGCGRVFLAGAGCQTGHLTKTLVLSARNLALLLCSIQDEHMLSVEYRHYRPASSSRYSASRIAKSMSSLRDFQVSLAASSSLTRTSRGGNISVTFASRFKFVRRHIAMLTLRIRMAPPVLCCSYVMPSRAEWQKESLYSMRRAMGAPCAIKPLCGPSAQSAASLPLRVGSASAHARS